MAKKKPHERRYLFKFFFAPLTPFPVHKFSQQMVTKGTWKFGVSASQPDVYDACNGMKQRFYHLQMLWCVPGGHHSRGEQKGGNKTETRRIRLF